MTSVLRNSSALVLRSCCAFEASMQCIGRPARMDSISFCSSKLPSVLTEVCVYASEPDDLPPRLIFPDDILRCRQAHAAAHGRRRSAVLQPAGD